MKKLFNIAAACLFGASTLLAQHQVERTTEVYAIKGQDTLLLDIYLDKMAPATMPRPMMIHVHGGGFSMGSRKNVMQEFFNRHYAELGWVSVSIDYRLGAAPTSMLPDGTSRYGVKGIHDIVRLACEDLVDATVYMLEKKELNIDPARVLTSGGSAGAITIVTTEYDLCNEAGYTQRLPNGFNYAGIISHAGAVGVMADTITWGKEPCPMLLMFGSKDNVVPTERGVSGDEQIFGSIYLHHQFQQMGVPHWFYVERNADHCIAMKGLDLTGEADRFYKDFVENKKTKSVVTEWEDNEPATMEDINAMLKSVPMYIIGYEKYIEEMDWSNMQAPTEVKY